MEEAKDEQKGDGLACWVVEQDIAPAGLAPEALVVEAVDAAPKALVVPVFPPKIPPPVLLFGEEVPKAEPVFMVLLEPNAEPVLDCPKPPKPLDELEEPNITSKNRR